MQETNPGSSSTAQLQERIRQLEQQVAERDRQILRLNQEVENAHELLAQVGDAADAGIFMRLDYQSNVIYLSDQLFQVLGYRPGGFPATIDAYLERVHPEDADLVREKIRELQASPTTVRYDFRFRAATGDYAWMRARLKSLPDEQNRPVRTVGSILRIHALKTLEERLRQANRKLKSALQSSALVIRGVGVGVWEWPDINSPVLIVSDRMYGMLGYEPGGFAPTMDDFIHLVHPDDRDRLLDRIRQHLEKNVPFEVEYRVRHKTGQYIWLLGSGDTQRDEQGRVLQFAGSIMNIHQEKMLEDELRRTNDNLLEAVTRLNLVVSGVDVGIWDWPDVRKEEIRISSRMRRMLHLGPEDRITTFDDLLKLVHPDDHDTFLETFYGHFYEGSSLWVEYRSLTDGRYRWFRATADSLRNEEGKALRTAGSLQDIHDRKMGEIKLNQLNKELEDLVYSVAHDLRAPVRHISSFVEIMIEDVGEELNDIGRNYLNNIARAATKLGKMIDDLLQVSRNQRLPLRIVEVDTHAMVENVLEMLRRQEKEDRVIQVGLQPLPRVISDPTLLEQVFQNLLSNALKYTRQQPEARIRIYAESRTSEIWFTVEDNGSGFDMKYYDKLFKFFHRLHTDEVFEGTGIGLANVSRIMERLGGRVWAKSRPGEGAAFTFSLPIG